MLRCLIISLLLTDHLVVGQEVSIVSDRQSGIYTPEQEVHWTIQVRSSSNGATLLSPEFNLKSGGLTSVTNGVLSISNGLAAVSGKLGAPGWLLLEISGRNGSGEKVRKLGGAIISPEKIQPSLPVPEDFGAFWNGKLKELAQVPANPEVGRESSGREGVDYFTVVINNIRGSRIHGQLAAPAGNARKPALLIVQWAGVYPLQKGWVTDRAAEGWLVLNISAHDLPMKNPDSFYHEQADSALKDYAAIGNDDRETSYFLRMYLSCYRAAEFLTQRPDWDGKTLVVSGSSQGGLQAIVTAGLHPMVTAALACVPAGCDHTGQEANRLPGWPMWAWKAQGKDPRKAREASRYYDVVNFAQRVRCPVLVGIGGIDTVCAPPGIFAAYNQFAGPKEFVFMPLADHSGKHDAYYQRFNAWLNAARKGEALPPAQ